MVSPTDPTIDDRERLEQFLAWRRATQRARWWPGLTALGWRWLTNIAAIGVLGAVFLAFASLLNGDLSQRISGEVVRSLPAPSATDPAAGIIEPDSEPRGRPPALSLPERPARAGTTVMAQGRTPAGRLLLVSVQVVPPLVLMKMRLVPPLGVTA